MGSSTREGELWGTYAEDWAFRAEPSTSPLWDVLLRGCNVGSGTSLLDEGCGAGGLSVKATELGATVTGLDASEALLTIARRRVPTGSFHQGDVETLPFPDASFDAVTASNSFQFAENSTNAAREAKRVLRPEGKLGIGMWCEPERCEMSAVFRAVQAIAPPPPGDPPPSLTVRDNLLAMIRSAGLNVIAEEEVLCYFQYETEDEIWPALRSPGILVAIGRKVGEDVLREAIMGAIEPFRTASGGVRMANWFRAMICE